MWWLVLNMNHTWIYSNFTPLFNQIKCIKQGIKLKGLDF